MSQVQASNTIAVVFGQTLSYGIGQQQKLNVPLILRSVFNVSGSLADQCSKIYNPPTLSLLASTPLVLDLTNLVDPVGAALSFTAVRFVAIRNNAQSDGWVLLVGNAGANEWDGLGSYLGTLTVYPSTAANDGFFLTQIPNTTGAAVASNARLLKLDPGPHPMAVDILIAGY